MKLNPLQCLKTDLDAVVSLLDQIAGGNTDTAVLRRVREELSALALLEGETTLLSAIEAFDKVVELQGFASALRAFALPGAFGKYCVEGIHIATIDRQEAYARLMQKFEEYASGRRSDARKGLETRQLAALLVQKYGLGMRDAYTAIFDGALPPQEMVEVIDRAVSSIDADWKATAEARWKCVAGLDLSTPRASAS